MKHTNLSITLALLMWYVSAGCMPYHPVPSRVTTGPVPTFRHPDAVLCDPKQVIEKAIQARGGEALLKKLQMVSYTGNGLSAPQNQVAHFKFRTTSDLPERIRDESDYEGGIKFVQVLNRDKGWNSIKNDKSLEVKDMDAVNLRYVRELLYVNQLLTLVPLREARFTLEPLPERRLEGVIVQGFVIKCKDKPDVTLFVEKENGLPLMVKVRASDPNTYVEKEQETYFMKYTNMHGIQFPKRWVVYNDGNKSMELNFEDFKLLDKVDDILFAKP
jgi:hypothetical protein